MKKNYTLIALLMLFMISGFSQTTLQQVLIASGGIFGNSDDHVMVSTYDPASQTSSLFGEVVRESVQDMIIANGSVFITAEDSIVKFNLATHEKEAAIYEPNLHRLYAWGDFLIVSRRSDINGAPADGIYLKIFNAEDLSLISEVEGISSDAASITVAQDTIYLAVPGDWMATEGHLAVIETTNWELVREMNLGTDAIGIFDLYTDDNFVYSVNKTPYLGTTGSVTQYSVLDMSYATTVVNHVFGKGVGRVGNTLYLGIDNGIGSYDLQTTQILESVIVPDQGSVVYEFISAAAFDSINNLFYVATTDYFSMGEGKIFNMNGDETGSFEAGISTEAIAFEYQNPNAVAEVSPTNNISIFPNPVTDFAYLSTTEIILNIQVFDILGNRVAGFASVDFNKIDLSSFKDGIYILKIETAGSIETQRIIKN